jgi:protein farnesyltransferase subunit beta
MAAHGFHRYSDAYHTNYVLSGLSSAQHKWIVVSARAEEAALDIDLWAAAPYLEGNQIFREEDRVGTTHPVYVIPQHKVEGMMKFYSSKQGF